MNQPLGGRRLWGVALAAALIIPLAQCKAPDPVPLPSASASPTSTPTVSPTPSPSHTATPTPSPSYSTSPTPSPSPTAPYHSEPFTSEQLTKVYSSDAIVDYIPLLDEFDDYKAENPQILELNLEKTLAINAGSSASQRDIAILDEYGDLTVTMADALGNDLSGIYRKAFTEGRLPKTTVLLSKAGPMRAASPSTNPAKDYFAYPRPYIAAPDRVVYIDKEGGTAYQTRGGSYPSGHTNQAYWQGTLLATLLPELAPQILARVSEVGNGRIVMAKHYPLDVIGGRMMGQASAAHRWADDEFAVLLEQASVELHAVLEQDCGASLAQCIATDTPYLSDAEAHALYQERMTYGFDRTSAAGRPIVVPTEATALLETTFPELNDTQRRQILEQTAIDSGFPLNAASRDGDWQRLDLLAALAAEIVINGDGSVTVVAVP